MSMDCLKPRSPARRSAPQLQWNLAEAEALINQYESYEYSINKPGDLRRVISLRMQDERWDAEARLLLARKGFRHPTTAEEVQAAEEAMADAEV